jgi:hypothetical protein
MLTVAGSIEALQQALIVCWPQFDDMQMTFELSKCQQSFLPSIMDEKGSLVMLIGQSPMQTNSRDSH